MHYLILLVFPKVFPVEGSTCILVDQREGTPSTGYAGGMNPHLLRLPGLAIDTSQIGHMGGSCASVQGQILHIHFCNTRYLYWCHLLGNQEPIVLYASIK